MGGIILCIEYGYSTFGDYFVCKSHDLSYPLSLSDAEHRYILQYILTLEFLSALHLVSMCSTC